MSEAPQEFLQDTASTSSGASTAALPLTVGRRLQQAREAAGLKVEDVALTLKFSARQIELLEADNYASLPGTTIVRGFVRSYAKFLRLDSDALLKLLEERIQPAQADVRPPTNMGVAEEDSAPKQFSLLASAAIVVALAALLLALWHFLAPDRKAVVAAALQQGRGEIAAPAEPAAPPASLAQPVTALPPPAAEPQASHAPPANVPAQHAESTSIAGEVTLSFDFHGHSWLEVTDASKKVLHTGQNPAGSQLTLNGRPPFDIMVGNASRVQLTYGDRVVDLAPHTRADVARFRLE